MNKAIESIHDKKIIFFDSECLLCNRYAVYILNADKFSSFYLAPINGLTYQKLHVFDKIPKVDAIIFYDNGRLSWKTKAIVEMAKHLSFKDCLLGNFISIIPYFISNIIYDLIAKFRYKIFGKVESCALIGDADKKRILP